MKHGVNRAILLGRIGKDPEVKTFENGGKVTTFSVATSESWKDKLSGEKKEQTEWTFIAAYNTTAELVERVLHKGDLVYIEGKLKTRSYDKNGETKYVTEVVADSFS